MIFLVGIFSVFALMGLSLICFVGYAVTKGIFQGIGDAWRYWAVRIKYKL